MPKPTTEINPETKNVPFFFVRVSPDLFKAVEEKRLALGYNKKKSVEIMADLFLAYTPTLPKSAPSRTPARKRKGK